MYGMPGNGKYAEYQTDTDQVDSQKAISENAGGSTTPAAVVSAASQMSPEEKAAARAALSVPSSADLAGVAPDAGGAKSYLKNGVIMTTGDIQVLPQSYVVALPASGNAYSQIRAALDAVPANAELVVERDFTVSSALALSKPLKWRMRDGVTATVTGSALFYSTADLGGSVFEGGSIDLQGSSNPVGLGIYQPNTSPVEIRRMTILNKVNAAILLLNTNGVRVRDCVLASWSGLQSAAGIILDHSSGCEVSGNQFVAQGTAIRSGASNSVAGDYVNYGNEILKNQILGGWSSSPYNLSGSGGTVTYTATVLTDTAAAFDTTNVVTIAEGASLSSRWSNIRVFTPAGTGSVTSATTNSLDVSGVDLVATGVKPGDYVRTATAWAKIDELLSTGRVSLAIGWRSLDPALWWKPIAPPAAATAITVHKVAFGRVAARTATTLTVESWRRIDGSDITPAAGARYEVVHPTFISLFGVHNAANSIGTRINGNKVQETFVEGIFACGRELIVTDNSTAYGHDMGITSSVTGAVGASAYNVISNNRTKHHAAAGIAMENNGDTVMGNITLGGGYRWDLGGGLPFQFRAGIRLMGDNCMLVGNQTFGSPFSSLRSACVHIDPQASGNRLRGNAGIGTAVGDTIDDSSGANTIVA